MSLAHAGNRGTTLHGGPHSRAGLLQRTTGRRMFVYPRRRPPGPVCHVRPSLRYCDPCPCPHLLSPGADGGAGEHFVETAAFHFLDPLSRSAPRLSGRLPRHPKAGRLAMGTASRYVLELRSQPVDSLSRSAPRHTWHYAVRSTTRVVCPRPCRGWC